MSTRKYECDGHMEVIDPARLMVGCIVRDPHSDGSLASYSDMTVTQIAIIAQHANDDRTYDTLAAALAVNAECVIVRVSRPYLYASTIGLCANWLVGVETFDVGADSLRERFRVVVQSTGEYARMGQAA